MVNFAVIVPAHNEAEVIRRTMEALCKAGASPKDIYVVDDASKDNTSEIAREAGVQVLTLANNVGKSEALNSAIDHFELCEKYDYVAFLDADTEVKENYFLVLREAAEDNPEVALFVGQVKSSRTPGFFSGVFSASRVNEYQISHDLLKVGQSRFGTVFVAPGCTSVYRSDVLGKLKYGNDTLAEDMDLTIQVHRMKGKIVYVPEAIVYTQDPATFRDYMKQVTRWQRGGWQVLKKHRLMSPFKRRWQRIDFYLLFMMLDSVIFNRIWVTIALMFWLGVAKALPIMSVELGIMFLFAVYAGIKNRRADTIYKFPLYIGLFYVNQLTYLRSFAEVFLFRRNVLSWNKVRRY